MVSSEIGRRVPDRPSWSSRTILHHMYAAKSAKTHHCSAYAALRQLSPPTAAGGGGTRSMPSPRCGWPPALARGEDERVVELARPRLTSSEQVDRAELPGRQRRARSLRRLPRRQRAGRP